MKTEGFTKFSLAMAPLAGVETRRGSRGTMKPGALGYRHGGPVYNFDGLRKKPIASAIARARCDWPKYDIGTIESKPAISRYE
uniref:phosphatidylglycerol lysyltransferase domain-containing protein n=1 Tax=Yoonia sp. TaxID=2212373 RepID=UPI00404794DB